ncbi:MAG: sialate O-acetylesterase [Chitinophagaceae bacterium]|nr:sialate O-acetylesterase [Chitinophagaceae bacterium]
MKRNIVLCFFILIILAPAYSNVRLPAIIGSHMVLQQQAKVKIWGWSEPGEKIIVKSSWDTTTYRTTGSSGAKWSIDIQTPIAGGPYKLFISGYNKIELEDVMIGEVWICSGQSNMEMSVNWGLPYSEDVKKAANTGIRFFHIPRTTSEYPQDDVKASWVVCDSNSMKTFSAIGYFFGKKLQDELNVPVGLINSSWGGTPAEAWTPREIVMSDTALSSAAKRLNPAKGWPVEIAATYNGMIYPVTNYNIAGAIWYQGEANVGTAATYQSLFTSMISAWRTAWHKELPFYFVQIAPFAGYGDQVAASTLREQQRLATHLSKTGMVVTTDLVDKINDIHPKLKKEVAMRLANYALAETYGKTGLIYKSPEYKNMRMEGNKIRIDFSNASNGLIAKDGEPREFYIAGADGRFVPANAKLEGHTAVVWSNDVANPKAVRFGFGVVSMPNVFSKEGLPVVPFSVEVR